MAMQRGSGRPGFNWEAKAWAFFWFAVLIFAVLGYLQANVWEANYFSWLAKQRDLPIVFAGIIAIVSFFPFGGWYLQRRRTNAYADLSASLGMDFTAYPSTEDLAPFAELSILNVRKAASRNFIQGNYRGTNLVYLDHEFEPLNSKVRTSVVIFPNAAAGLPNFILTQRISLKLFSGSLLNRELDNWPDARIGSETHAIFAENCRVGCAEADVDEVRRTFSPGVMDFFGKHKNWNVEAIAGHLAVYRIGRQRKPSELPKFLERALEVLHVLQANEA